MELQHFSHDEHPLFFREIMPKEDDGDEEACRCEGCLEVISGAYYGCSDGCKFFLHKLCAELPPVREHPLHPGHRLTLRVRSPCLCDVCHKDCSNFAYRCSECDFDIDIICASAMEREIDHPSHEHPLTPVRRTALLLCDACGQKHEGTWYQCTTCVNFWIHRDCASLPTSIERSDHKHPLTLSYTIPSQYATFYPDCDICRQRLRRFYWVYYCGKCRYFTHVTCAPSKIEPRMSIHPTVIEDHDSDRLYLPPDDIKSINAIQLLLRRLGLGKNERATKLNHFSHDHPLILFDVRTAESESCPGENFKNDDILCEACVKPFFSPTTMSRGKLQCDFILHKCCTELPTKLQHPSHPRHPLMLHPKSSEFLGLFFCEGCGLYCSGFAFRCVDCNFYLDVTCASLPSTIKHKAHGDHLLHMEESQHRRLCTACHEWIGYMQFLFCCDTCDFNLHAICSLFPRALRHRYDEHPLTLTYSPVEDREADEYYCEICEQEMNPRLWFYHCLHCDRSMHPHCALDDKYPNVKFRDILNVKSHRHPLSFARFASLSTRCSHCSHFLWSGTFKCTKCNYKLCVICARDLPKK